MKTLNVITFAVGLTLLAMVVTGCGRSNASIPVAADAGKEPVDESGITYHAKSGLSVQPETAKFIGLETAEVSERVMHATQEISARIFRPSTISEPRALASALMSATDAATLRPGLVSIGSPSEPVAEVLWLDHSAGAQTGMVEVLLQVNDSARALESGGWLTFQFATGATNAVTVVPLSALVHTSTGDFVYLENGAHLTRAAVTIARRDVEFAEVTDGLLAGDKVVVRPVMTLWMAELHNVNGGDVCCAKPPGKP